MKQLCLVAVNIRSTHNVGAFLRTADAFAATVLLTGITPYPKSTTDKRLPHSAEKTHLQIAKTALGAENAQHWLYSEDLPAALRALKDEGYTLVALEQAAGSVKLTDFRCSGPIALLVGEEVHGLTEDVLALCSSVVEIPMHGIKESLNVSVAAGIGLYHLRYHS